MVNRPYANAQQLNIDYAVVNHNSTATSPGNSSRSSSVSGAAIGGIVAGTVALIAAIVSVLFFMWRRKRSAGGVYDLGTPSHMYELDPDSAEPLGRRLNPFYSARSQFQDQSPLALPFRREESEDPFANPGIGHSDDELPRGDLFSRNISEPLSSNPSQTASGYRSSAPQETAPGITHNASAPIAAVSEMPRNPRGKRKRLQNARPSVANQTLTHVPRDELEVSRMRVDGRPQDFGAVGLDHEDVCWDDLPPDYNQATEPFQSQ